MAMIDRLLIANRGEIARRIMRTARRLGVRTIAIYSEADASMPFVREADDAVLIGPAPARESYLAAGKILDAARRTGAAAIHPGYGFLSENAAFAEAVEGAGLVWVGPPPSSIRAMGLKDAAKALMMRAGVPVTPGYMGEDQAPERLRAAAGEVGYPVLIKAVAGGGGKGMRRVDERAHFIDALASCKREAAHSFGDERVLIEKYILSPRHIEVQIFGDTRGSVIHLFERDCSLQRRHQKVIEEAPAPGMDPATRAAVCGAAVKAARAVGYVGAGTVEFIADASDGLRADRIWFMEMNTRLQVEHPVTEAITGQDLVEWQLRVASGEPLPCAQDELTISGWAMEARLYAENPATGFLPSIGPLTRLRLPRGIRVDSGVEEGDQVSPHYDPMIAKLIVHADTREDAAIRLARAAGSVEVWPVCTNAGFLARAAADPDFVGGRVDTGFIERHMARLLPAVDPTPETIDTMASSLMPPPGRDPWSALQGFRLNGPPDMRVAVDVAGRIHVGQARAHGTATVVGEEHVMFLDGNAWPFKSPVTAQPAPGTVSDGAVLAPMPGHIVAVDVATGDAVKRGQKLVVLEAMKMEHTLHAPFDGVVATLNAASGARVREGDMLICVERAD
jgi:3-methylcrotonyl-CoA carboxylase alpha subunit